MVQLPTEFRATLESYRGPLDLLLYLIKKEELDIFEIPISRITEQYLLYIQILKSLDPNICGEFLVTAAHLMEIKSKTLLPVVSPEDENEETEDPRLDLVLQLLEYKKYKDRALLLDKKIEEHSLKYRRPHQDVSGILAEDDTEPQNIGAVSMWDLLTSFQKVQLNLSARQPHRILFEDRPIEEFMKSIKDRLENAREVSLSRALTQASSQEDEDTQGWVPFEQFFEDCDNRYDAVGYLLALLELAKQSELMFDQEVIFGPIRIRLCLSR